ncbi:MAG TPA: hypothetical protein VJ900_02665 [Patescibacteria group bacterium]|nr:hypothetical protein [Patescibacteria group bacterium]
MAKLKKGKKSKKEYIYLIIFVVIMVCIGFVIIKYLVLSEFGQGKDDALIKPAYLKQPIPDVEKIITVISDPKFKEMVYIESFFRPIKVNKVGRPNPFAPFGGLKEEESDFGYKEEEDQEQTEDDKQENVNN